MAENEKEAQSVDVSTRLLDIVATSVAGLARLPRVILVLVVAIVILALEPLKNQNQELGLLQAGSESLQQLQHYSFSEGEVLKDERKNLTPSIMRWASRFGVPHWLAFALVEQESNFNPEAVSPVGAIGLTQVFPRGAIADYEKAFPKDKLDYKNPEHNLKVGFWYLGRRIPHMLKAYGEEVSLRNLLVAYNAGITRVKLKDHKLPAETRTYIDRISKKKPLIAFL